jgi:hypothetical protein
MDALGTELLYLALAAAVLGAVSLIHPLRFLAIRSRRTGLVVLLGALAAFAAGASLPVTETRVDTVRTRLDEFAPVFQFDEFHSTYISAPKDRVYEAIHEVRPAEIRLFQTLMRIRFLAAPRDDRPILTSFTASWFRPLADDPAEIVFGRAAHGGTALPPEQFTTSLQAPAIRIVMNFHINEIDPTHCLLTTETRVYALGSNMLHGFAAYWRIIHPGSALIRRMWLRDIKRRAEAPPPVNARRRRAVFPGGGSFVAARRSEGESTWRPCPAACGATPARMAC